MDIEQKLALIQQIHREQAENERYIYDNLRRRNNNKGTEYICDYSGDYGSYFGKDSYRGEPRETWFGSFRFRLLVAALLFLCFWVMDTKKITYGEVGSIEIVQYISENMDMEEFIPVLKR